MQWTKDFDLETIQRRAQLNLGLGKQSNTCFDETEADDHKAFRLD
jgi:hypothetical protein